MKTRKSFIRAKNRMKRTLALFVAIIMMLSAFMFTSTVAPTAQAAPVSDSSLLAWYAFEAEQLTSGASGERKILDQSGKGNDATMYWSTGTLETVAEGIDGASLNFNNGTRNANGAYVQLPSDVLKNTDNYTISAWFKLTSMPSWARLFDFGSAVAGTAATRQAYIMYAPYSWHTQARFETTANYSGGTTRVPFTGTMSAGEWVHIDITRDSKATNIYMNGTLYATGAAGLSPRGYDFLGAYLGRSGFEGDNYFDGQMDDIRIYNRALTSDDVLAQYRNYSAVASLETSGGPYLMTYTLPAGFSGHLDDSATPNSAAILQVGVFDYSMHYAYSEDGKTWIPLNDNRGVLYWENSAGPSSSALDRYVNPRIVLIDGVYHLYGQACSGNNTVSSTSYFHWSSSDLVNWTQLGTVTAGNVPAFPANPTTISTAAKPYNAAIGNIIAISDTELTALKDAYATPYFDDVNLTTTVGVPADLPNYGTISLNNGNTIDYGHSVTWENEPDYETPGVYEVSGTVNYNYENPLNRNGADPDIYYHDGWYYYTASFMDDSIPAAQQSVDNQYTKVALRRARTVQGLATSEDLVVWDPPTSGSARGSGHIWAPEIHRVTFNGVSTWAIYFAASPKNSKWDIRMMVTTCSTDDPWTGTWSTPVVLEDGNTSNNFDLDATVLEHNGKNYLIWANTRSGQSSLWIAEMTSPTTINTDTAQQSLIIKPDHTFENRTDRVVEGATILKENGKIWLSYSGGSTNSNYNMGLAYAIDSPTTDVMSADAWTKLDYPIMHSNRSSQQFGPGHATFTYDYNVEGIEPFPILSYHARGNEDYSTNHAPAPLYSPTRWARIAPVYYHRDGTPYVGIAPADGEVPGMSLKATITVLPADEITMTPLSKTLKSAAEGYAVATPGEFTIANPTEEVKNISLTLSGDDVFSLNATNVTVPAKSGGVNGQVTFTVTPVPGLGVGVYSGRVTAQDGDVVRTANFTFTVYEKAGECYANTSFDLTELTPSATSDTTSYITNASNTQTLKGYVIQALYNGARLEKMVTKPFSIAPGSTEIVKSALVLPDTLSDAYTLKCFVWDANLIPMDEATIFENVEVVELSDPMVWYDFDQTGSTTAGTTIPDRTGNGYDGTLTGTSGSATWTGSALTVTNTVTTATGTGRYVYAPRGMMDGKNTFTLSLYALQSYASSAADRFTFAIQQNPATTPNNYFFFNNGGRYKAAITTGNYAQEAAGGLIDVAASNRNVWEHYVLVLTPTNMTIYVNGKKAGSVATTKSISDLGTNLNVDLGRSSYNGDTYFAGSFGDFRIYEKAFNEAEVNALTNQILERKDPRLPQSLVNDWEALALLPASGSTITSSLSGMPTAGPNGSTVTWGATNPVYLSADGQVRRPSQEEGDQKAVLVATLTAPSGEQTTKSFIYTIAAEND